MRKLSMLLLTSALAVSNIYAQATITDTAILKANVDKVVIPYMKDNKIPGAAIAVYKDGKEYYFNYGKADTKTKTDITSKTLFEIASNTKLFTATLLAYEVGQGKIKLDDSIVNYLPALKDTTNLPIDKVTPLNLATHTSSFPRAVQKFGVSKGDLNGFINALKTWQPDYPVGTKYLYSNAAFGLLGTVVSNASGTSYSQLLQTVILKPLNMHNTYINVPKSAALELAQGYGKKDNAAPHFVPTPILGGGELVSSTSDLMQFLKATLNIKTGQASPQLLAAMQLMQKPYFNINDRFAMGLAWEIRKSKNGVFLAKNGRDQGFNTFITFSPQKKIGIIALFNKNLEHGKPMGRNILQSVMATN